MLQEVPLPGYKILTVPFVDLAGVIASDQGKCRLPHDHNRDYIPNSLYPTVEAIKAPYFGKLDRMMTRESYLATGRAFARAVKRFIDL